MSDSTSNAGDKPLNDGRPLPPVEHRFKPGQSGNPRGRPPNVGQSLVECMNDLDALDLTTAELRAIANDPNEKHRRAVAAQELVLMRERGDLADFEDVMRGNETLEDARRRGLNTSVLKKLKRKSKRVDYVSGSKDGDSVELEVECDIELHNRAGEALDRVMDRTNGRPTQAVRVEAKVTNTSTQLPAEALTNANVLSAFIELEQRLRDAGGACELPDPQREG